MATVRTYSATAASFSPLLHLRLNEDEGTVASDSAGGLDGEYRGDFTLGADGPIGNGAVEEPNLGRRARGPGAEQGPHQKPEVVGGDVDPVTLGDIVPSA